MLIESLFKRPNAPVNLGGRDYFFRPLDNNPESPHVCDVADQAHAERLLSITEGYRPYSVQPLARAQQVAYQTQAPAAPDIPPETAERVNAILSANVPDIRNTVPTITDLPLLAALLATESVRTTPPPRATVTKLLEERIAKLTAKADGA